MSELVHPKRGDVYRVDLEPVRGSEQQGRARPCVVLSVSALNARLRQVGVVPLSSSAKVLAPMVIAMTSLGEHSVALCHQLRTIDKLRLGKAMGHISPQDLTAIEEGVKQVYGLS